LYADGLEQRGLALEVERLTAPQARSHNAFNLGRWVYSQRDSA
jgi:hypothetical protein